MGAYFDKGVHMIECKFFEMGDHPKREFPNCMAVKKVDSDFQQLIVMNLLFQN